MRRKRKNKTQTLEDKLQELHKAKMNLLTHPALQQTEQTQEIQETLQKRYLQRLHTPPRGDS